MRRAACILLLAACSHRTDLVPLELTPLAATDMGESPRCRVLNAAGETVFVEEPTALRTFARVDGRLFEVKLAYGLGAERTPAVGDALVRVYSDGRGIALRFDLTVTFALTGAELERTPHGEAMRASAKATVTRGRHQREHDGLTMACL